MKAQRTITIDEKVDKAVEERAEKEGRTYSNMVEYLLRKAVEDRDK